MQQLTCPSCRLVSEFYVSHTGKRSSYCKNCSKARTRKWAQTHQAHNLATKKKWKEEHRDAYLAIMRRAARKNRTGVTGKQYTDKFVEQKGCCAICGKHQSEFSASLAADHDWKTKAFRGILCMFCNTALGKFKDDVTLLQRAIDYLKTGELQFNNSR